MSWSLAWHWVLRLAIVLALAILLGVAFAMQVRRPLVYEQSIAYFLIEGIILSAWLSLGAAFPLFNAPDVDDC